MKDNRYDSEYFSIIRKAVLIHVLKSIKRFFVFLISGIIMFLILSSSAIIAYVYGGGEVAVLVSYITFGVLFLLLVCFKNWSLRKSLKKNVYIMLTKSISELSTTIWVLLVISFIFGVLGYLFESLIAFISFVGPITFSWASVVFLLIIVLWWTDEL